MTEKAGEDRRLPGAQAEFTAFYDKIEPLIDRTQSEEGTREVVRITLDVPKEWMALSAWLSIKEHLRRHGKLGAIPADITLDPRLVRHHAKAYLARLIDSDMHGELHMLATGQHPFLYAPKEEENRPNVQTLDGDIPF